MVFVEALKRCSVEAVDQRNPLTIQRDINLRSSSNQCFSEFNQHDFHLNGLVFHPAWRVAPAHGVHDYRCGFLGLFSDGLHHLSRERRRKIFGIHGMDCRYLFSDTSFACSACFCDAASGDYHPYSGVSSPMGSPQANRALDDPYLALCLSHRRVCVFDALQMVSSGRLTPNLALGR
jgi:hypothetical protein